jgi:hypothetical protein
MTTARSSRYAHTQTDQPSAMFRIHYSPARRHPRDVTMMAGSM